MSAYIKGPDHIEKMDWRINNLTWTTAPFIDPVTKTTVPTEAFIGQSALVTVGKERVGIIIPNATALFLDLSQRYRVEAQYYIDKCMKKKNREALPIEESFIFYQKIMASVIFACTALEAFVNEEIPDAYVHIVQEKSSTRHYDKEQIERQLNLDTKLGDVLPGALNVKSPKGGKLWNDYSNLRDLRDRVIHMKTKDRDFRGEDATSIWNALMSDPVPETHTTAKSMMKYFLDTKGQPPRWFVKCPF